MCMHDRIRMQKISTLLAVLAIAVMFSVVSAGADCHPECRWQCDDPVCPAMCHPICERPKCQMQCDETPCAKCTVHCAKPVCTVRCPKDMCEKEDCPKCETVCEPAECHTKCSAPEPTCSPECEDVKCNWKCQKPTLCPKPKCELQCSRPACEAAPDENEECCSCSDGRHAAMGVASADSYSTHTTILKPTLLEVMNSMRHAENTSGKAQCCPCAK